MSNMSDYLENKIVDHIFRARAFTAPATLYVALFTTAEPDAGGGTEVSGGAYARVAVTPSDTAFNATQGGTPAAASSGTGGATANAAAITFPAPTANWGQVTDIAIMDASSGGNVLFRNTLTTAKTVNNGDPAPVIAIGALGITFA